MLKSLRKEPMPDEKDDLLFNRLGIPRGKARAQVLSTLGTIVRCKVPVYAPSWIRDVPRRVKDALFDELRVLYILTYILTFFIFYILVLLLLNITIYVFDRRLFQRSRMKSLLRGICYRRPPYIGGTSDML